MKPDYVAVLYQWLFLFALLGIFLFPAFRLKRIAKASGRKGWLYFLLGLGVGFLAMVVNRILGGFLRQVPLGESLSEYLWIPFLTVGYGLVFVAIHFIAERIRPGENARGEDILDSELINDRKNS